MKQHREYDELGTSPVTAKKNLSSLEGKQDKQEFDVFHRLFEEQVDRSPGSNGVVFEGVTLTYDVFNDNANILAKTLVSKGIHTGELVALLCRRGIHFLISMIGIFKSGGAYLPLDPRHPAERQLHILQHSRVRFILITREFLGQMEEYLRSIPIEERPVSLVIEDLLERGGTRLNLPCRSTPRELAYVIYTSGSTGKPKGAMVEQQGMVNHLYAKVKELEISANDRIIQNASQCFDISVWQYLSCLLVGGSVYIVDDEIAHDADRLLYYTEKHQITLLEVVPSILHAMLEGIETGRIKKPCLRSLRWLIVTGEALKPALARRWFGHYPGIPLLNAYGPTECSDDITHCFIYEPPDEDVIYMPIGKPIINTRLYIVKEEGHQVTLCSAEEPGELWAAGISVGRGYLNDVERSAWAFPEGNFPGITESRVYRTGDLVRLLPDGNIEFLGRIDRQVKVQGFRVELGEIESFLLKYPGIKDCVVKTVDTDKMPTNLVARQPVLNVNADNKGESHQRLIAYFIPDDSQRIRTPELRSYLSDQLPYYMVPAQFVRMQRFPLSPNGKVDYNNLPAPENVRPELENDYAAPRNDLEAALAMTWEEVLGFSGLGIQDNFFEVGGDSLLAMKILNRLKTAFQVEVSYQTLNRKQTIEELALHIQQEQGKSQLPITPLIAYPPRERYPLTYAQKRIWFVCQMQKGNPFYNFAGILYVKGKLDKAAFHRAWNEVLGRHAILNTRFATDGGVPYQVFDHPESLPVQVVDLKNYPVSQRNQRLMERVTSESQVPFDLENERLIRFKLYLTGEEEYAVLLVMHEIILDGWGTCVMLNEFGRLYDGYLSGKKPHLAPVTVQFKDLAIWEDAYLDKEVRQNHEAYWSRKLSGELPILALPFDYPRPPHLDYKGNSVGLLLNESVCAGIKKLADNANVTLFTVLSTCFKLLLHYYSNQDDIIVGSPIVNRNSKETENMVGFQINMIAFRTDLSGNPTFLQLLERESQVITEAISYAEYPFIELLELINPRRDTTVSPIFQVMFNMLNFPYNPERYENFQLYFREIETQYTKYDISFYGQEQGEQIYLQFSYLIALFQHSTIERMMKNFEILIKNMVKNPGLEISQIDFLSEEERELLLEGFNSRAAVPGLESTMVDIFKGAVEKNPDGAAYIFQDQVITYGLLDKQSTGAAAYLKSRGCKPGKLVALYMHKSLGMINVILAILKVGAVYVPLDPHYPPAMLRTGLDDVNAEFMVLGEHSQDFLGFSKNKIYLDEIEQLAWEGIGIGDANEDPDRNAAGGFNVLYTSSSTGKSKGVLVTQQAVLNRLDWMWNAYPFIPDDLLLFHKSFALVGTSWELLGGLLAGIRTLMITREEQQDIQKLCRLIQVHRISYFHASPPLIKALQEHIEGNGISLDSLRLVTTSAEPISPQLVNKWKRCVPNAPLLNLYGLTECSSNISEYNTAQMAESAGNVPLGTPLNHVRIIILNPYMKLSPLGVIGEICVSGLCLARGYLNNARLTHEKFISHQSNPRGVLFRTGDFGRWTNDGNLAYIGRRDEQVKIHGYRIELLEVERNIQRHKEVKEAAVVAMELRPGEKELVAYVKGSEHLNVSVLRSLLEEFIPTYMIPTHYVKVEELPLTHSGKVDKKNLPRAEELMLETGSNYYPPRNDFEKKMVDIWQNVLEREKIGIKDNFFDIGGHSLKAAQLVAFIKKNLEVKVELRMIFDHSTIESLTNKNK